MSTVMGSLVPAPSTVAENAPVAELDLKVTGTGAAITRPTSASSCSDTVIASAVLHRDLPKQFLRC